MVGESHAPEAPLVPAVDASEEEEAPLRTVASGGRCRPLPLLTALALGLAATAAAVASVVGARYAAGWSRDDNALSLNLRSIASKASGPCGEIESGVLYSRAYSASLPGEMSLQECCGKCQAVWACASWVWVSSGSVGECTLKGGDSYGTHHKETSSEARGVTMWVPGNVFSGHASGKEGLKDVTQSQFQKEVAHSRQEAPKCPEPDREFAMPVSAAPPADIVVLALSFNLEWWSNMNRNLPGELHPYRQLGGNAATELLAKLPPYDLLAFQECADVGWLLETAGLSAKYSWLQGQEGVAVAWRKQDWELHNSGWAYVSEDLTSMFWGLRGVQWIRVVHKGSGRPVLFLNHHGPLPIGLGGTCGGTGTAINILDVIQKKAFPGDGVVLLGDFNAAPDSATLQVLSQFLTKALTGVAFGGIDNVFTNLEKVFNRSLGSGGSDHEAQSIVLKM